MKRMVFAGVVCLLFSILPAHASSISVTGILPDELSSFAYEFTLAGAANVNFQTFSFGGGTNAANTVIPAGGFAPMISLFLGTGPTATIVLSGGNPAASAAGTTPITNAGACGPAATVLIGAGFECGDAQMSLLLGAGTYTLLVSDYANQPLAVNPGPPGASTIGDGFGPLAPGVFQACNTLGDCIPTNGNFAFDVTSQGTIINVPEPATLSLLGSGLAVLAGLTRRRSRNQALPKL